MELRIVSSKDFESAFIGTLVNDQGQIRRKVDDSMNEDIEFFWSLH